MGKVANSPPLQYERRTGKDRRERPKTPRLFTSSGRRRKWGRRITDPGGYVDQYDSRTWAVAFSVLILSSLDAHLTMLQIYAGRVEEWNPLMRYLIHSGGPYTFFALKITITSLAMAVIVLHKDFRIGRIAARFSLWSYILVHIYHLCLVLFWPRLSGYHK